MSSKCFLYKHFKPDFGFEKYLLDAPFQFVRYIIKYRLSNHKLPVEKGRYTDLERSERICDICDMNVLGDEYHYVMECKNIDIETLRKQIIPAYFRTNINMLKFIEIMKKMSTNPIFCYKIGKLIKCIMCVVK